MVFDIGCRNLCQRLGLVTRVACNAVKAPFLVEAYLFHSLGIGRAEDSVLPDRLKRSIVGSKMHVVRL